jgi:sigma-B regulation protein RsbU (phosphoserine phosphatase)
MFVTVWLGILEISTGKLSCANAGHEWLEVKTGEAFAIMKDKHGLLLGIMEGMKYVTYDIQLHKGDTVFVYTDGVAEATNASDELFGIDRLTEALNKAPDGSPEELIAAVGKAVNEFVGDAPQFDDLTMLAITIK